MKKKFIKIILFCLVVFGVFTVSANAVSTVASGSCGANGDNVTWTLDDAGVLTISGTGAMADYASYTALPWYNDRNNIKTVTIKNGVTSVGDYAFYGCIFTSVTLPESMTEIGKWALSCSKLSSLTLPAGLTTIGENALRNCGFASITIPGSVTSIGRYAFYGNKLAHVTIESGVKSIDEQAFCGCTGLTDIMIPTSVTSIADYAFYECSALASITIPGSVTSIGRFAFYRSGLESLTVPGSVKSIDTNAISYCAALTSVTLQNGIESIGEHAFTSCTALTGITIPASVTGIGNYAFYGCTKLSAITVAAGSSTYSSVGGVLFNQDKTKLLQYPAGKEEAIYAIPNGVTGIENYAFYGCAALRNITIPENVTSIGSTAFYGCTGLTDITIPEGVKSIGAGAFMSCAGLRSVTIEGGVESVGNSAFYYCTALKSATFEGDAPTTFGTGVFSGCADDFTLCVPKDNATWTVDSAYNSSAKTWNGYPIAFVNPGSTGDITGDTAFELLANYIKKYGSLVSNTYYYYKTGDSDPAYTNEYYLEYDKFYNMIKIETQAINKTNSEDSISAFITIYGDGKKSGSAEINYYRNHTTIFGGGVNLDPKNFDSDCKLTYSFLRIEKDSYMEASGIKRFKRLLLQNLLLLNRDILVPNGFDLADLGFEKLAGETGDGTLERSAAFDHLAELAMRRGTFSTIDGGYYSYTFKTGTSGYADCTDKYELKYFLLSGDVRLDLTSEDQKHRSTYYHSDIVLTPELSAPYEGYYRAQLVGSTLCYGDLSVTPSEFSADTYSFFDDFTSTGFNSYNTYGIYVPKDAASVNFTISMRDCLKEIDELLLRPEGYSVEGLGFTKLYVPVGGAPVGEVSGNGAFNYLANYTVTHGSYYSDIEAYQFCFHKEANSADPTFTDKYFVTYFPLYKTLSFALCSEKSSNTYRQAEIVIPLDIKTPYIGYFTCMDSYYLLCKGELSVATDVTSSFKTGTLSGSDTKNAGTYAAKYTEMMKLCLQAVDRDILKPDGRSILSLGIRKLPNSGTAPTSGSCGNGLTWSFSGGKLTVSGTGAMADCLTDTIPWLVWTPFIRTVEIGRGVTSVGKLAFYGCTALESVTLPNSLTSIGDYAFCGCTALESVTIPSSVKSIGDYAFYNCSGSTVSFSGVTIPSGAAAYVAVYGQNGQMLALKKAFSASDGVQVLIPDTVYQGMKTAKLFIFQNGTMIPTAMCQTVSK